MPFEQESLFTTAPAVPGKIEKQLGHSLERPLLGVDEAGRGPLAGPVVAGAVCLPPDCSIPGLNDSKKLTARQRESLFDQVLDLALVSGVGVADHAEIDELNILQATFLAMERAVEQALAGGFVPHLIVVDGKLPNPRLRHPQRAIIKGDSLSLNIAAASILAKVTRDRMMQEFHQLYPCYDFERHKGYPTRAHRAAIQVHGPCPIHRKSFKGVREWVK